MSFLFITTVEKGGQLYTVYQIIYIFIFLTTYLYIYLTTYLFICLTTYLFIYLTIHVSRYREHEVEQDEPVCEMVTERRCNGVTGRKYLPGLDSQASAANKL